MSPLIEELHDIEGIDPIGFWPLSMVSWLCIFLGILFIGTLSWGIWRQLRYLRSWKRETFKNLDKLRENLSPTNAKETVVQLSQYLRRIAVHRFPRKECAGLVGNAWLEWLCAHDPNQFDWKEKGRVLIEVPYTPGSADLPLDEIQELIKASRCWVS